jgi:N-acetylmuramoyl-L-alanine amidase-like protein
MSEPRDERASQGPRDDPSIPPALDVVRDLSDEEYAATYASGDGGHRLPPDLLAALERLADGEVPDEDPEHEQLRRFSATAATLTLPFIGAYAHGGHFAAGRPRVIIVHSTEGPMSRGNARALAGPSWFGGPKAGTSAHAIHDPAESIQMVHDDTIAWHVGPGGNAISVGDEHCGRTTLSPAEWLSGDGRAMLDRSARWNAQRARRLSIPPRWLTLTQLRNGERGFATHNDVRLALGGTTHSDPGPNFPYAWYMQRVQFWFNGGTTAASTEEDDVPLTGKDAQTVWSNPVEVPKAQQVDYRQRVYSAEAMLFGANYWAQKGAKAAAALQTALSGQQALILKLLDLVADGNTVQPEELQQMVSAQTDQILDAIARITNADEPEQPAPAPTTGA